MFPLFDGLWMIWDTLMMLNKKLLSHSYDGIINKMSSLIISYTPCASKIGNNILKYETRYHISGTIFHWPNIFFRYHEINSCGKNIFGL